MNKGNEAAYIRITFMCAAEGIELIGPGLAMRLGAEQDSIEWVKSPEAHQIHLDLRIPFRSVHEGTRDAMVRNIPQRMEQYFRDRSSVTDQYSADRVGLVDLQQLPRTSSRFNHDMVNATQLGAKVTDAYGVERERFVAIIPANLKRTCRL